MKDQPFKQVNEAALEAAERLVEAYRRGKTEGGHVDWSDLDIAHEWARRAVFEARQRCRRERRQARYTVTPEPGRGLTAAGEPPADHLADLRTESQRAASAEMLAHARYFIAIANTEYGSYDLREALDRAFILAGFVLGFERLARRNTAARVRLAAPLDGQLARIRELAQALLSDEDHDEPSDLSMENACELAGLIADLDRDCSAGALPRAWQRR